MPRTMISFNTATLSAAAIAVSNLFGAHAANADTEDQARRCLKDAMNSLTVEASHNYLDHDGGYKKYYESDQSLIGASLYLNPFPAINGAGEGQAEIQDHIQILTKAYHEFDNGTIFDASNTIDITINSDGTYSATETAQTTNIDELHSDTADAESSPSELSEDQATLSEWTINASHNLALYFTVCMNAEPFTRDDGQMVSMAVWPHFVFE